MLVGPSRRGAQRGRVKEHVTMKSVLLRTGSLPSRGFGSDFSHETFGFSLHWWTIER